MSTYRPFQQRSMGPRSLSSRSLSSVAQGPRDVILAATERARRGSLAKRKAERGVPVQPVAHEGDDANVPQDEENGMGSGRGELSILPTVEEFRPHREGISLAAASEEKTAADTRGQGDQTSRRTPNPLSRLFLPRSQRAPLETERSGGGGNQAAPNAVESDSGEDDNGFGFTVPALENDFSRARADDSTRSSKNISKRWRTNSNSSGDGYSGVDFSRMFRTLSTQLRSHATHASDQHDHHGPVTLAQRGKLTEADEVLLDGSEADYDAFDDKSERAEKRLFSPNVRFHRWHATFMLIVLFIFVFYMPFRVAFFPRESGAWSFVDVTWNVLFFVDILIHLNTGFVDKDTGMVVYQRRRIFKRYAAGWLIVDLLAAFPLTFMPGMGPDDAEGNHEIAYLFSAPKLLRIYGLLGMAQENHRIHEGAFLAARTLLSVVVTAHLFGCGWYMLATLSHTECEEVFNAAEDEVFFVNGFPFSAGDYIDSECPWTYRNGYVLLSLGRQYLGSVYWALTTLTTVGYGDLSARTADEQVYSMAVQIVGVSWYGYIVGTWASILNSFDSEDKEQRSKMREVVAFTKAASLPPDTAKKVRQHFRFALYRKDNWITFNEQELVGDMPSSLRAEVVTYVQRNTIVQIPWLQGKDPTFVADVVLQLKPYIFHMNEELYKEGRPAEEMFFITSGRVMVKYKDTNVGVLKAGHIAGLDGLVSLENHKLTAVAADREVKCLTLMKSQFFVLMESYPDIMQELIQVAKDLSRKIAATSEDAKADMMNNQVLAELIVPMTTSPDLSDTRIDRYRMDSAFEQDRSTQLSIGHNPDEERSRLPSAWESMPPQAPSMANVVNAAVRTLNASPKPPQPPSLSGSTTGTNPVVMKSTNNGGVGGDGSSDSSNDPLAGSQPGTAASTVTNAGPGSQAGLSGPTGWGSSTGSLSTVVGTGFEDAVSREVGLMLSGIEARLGQAVELAIAKALGARASTSAAEEAPDVGSADVGVSACPE